MIRPDSCRLEDAIGYESEHNIATAIKVFRAMSDEQAVWLPVAYERGV